MLTLVLGRKRSGKTTTLFNEIKNKTASNKKVIYIVPEQMVFLAEKKILNVLGEEHSFLINAISFNKLTRQILKEYEDYNTIKFLDKETKKLILNKVILNNKEKFLTFKNSSYKTEFCDMIASQLTELKKYCVDEIALNEVASNGNTPKELKDKLSDIALIYKEFNNALTGVFRDEDDVFSIAAKQIAQNGLFNDSNFYIDGFTGFTMQEKNIIKALLKNGANITVSLTLDPKITPKISELFYTTYLTKNSLIKLCEDTSVKIIECSENYIENEEISHIEQNLFRFNKVYDNKNSSISILNAKNSYFEVLNSAVIIIEKIKENENLKFKDFVVAVSDFDEYKKSIDTIFKEYKIPYYLNEKSSIADLPVSNLISTVMDLIISNNKLDLIFSYLKSGYFCLEDYDAIYKFENFVNSTGVKGFELLGKIDLEQIIEKKEEYNFKIENKKQLYQVFNEAIVPIKNLKNNIKDSKNAFEISKNLYQFIKEIKLESKIEKYAEDFTKENEHIKASQFIQVYNAIVKAIERTALILKDEEINFKTYRDILSLSINNESIKTIPLLMDSVMVTDVKGLSGNECKYVLLLGAKDGALPSYQNSESIINESDREYLNQLGISLSMSCELKIIEEYIHIYDILTCATKGLFISYPKMDFSLEEQRQSSVISLLLEMFPSLEINSNFKRNLKTKEMLFNEAIVKLRDEGNSKYMNYFLYDDEYSQIANKCVELISNKKPNQEVSISKENMSKILKDDLYTAVTRLEKYRACRFSYFVNYVLKGKELQIFKPDVANIGSLSHDILEKFSLSIRKDNLTFDLLTDDYIDNKLDKIVEREVKKVNNGLFLNDAKTMFLIKKIKRISKRTIKLLKNHFEKGQFTPLGYEMRFAPKGGDLEGITIELDNNRKVHLKGVIDRVDVLDTENGKYVRIIDYKSGYKTLDFYEIYNRLSLQLAVYLITMLNQKDMGELKPGGMLYLTLDEPIISIKNKSEVDTVEGLINKKLIMKGILIDDPEIVEKMDENISVLNKSDIIDVKTVKKELVINNSLTNKQFEMLFDNVMKDISKMGKEIYEGKFDSIPVKSPNKDGCAYCEYNAVCGYEEGLCQCDEVVPSTKEEIFESLGGEISGRN